MFFIRTIALKLPRFCEANLAMRRSNLKRSRLINLSLARLLTFLPPILFMG